MKYGVPRTILTSLHLGPDRNWCDYWNSALSVGSIAQVGAQTRNSTNDGSVMVQIVDSVTHPDYNDGTKEYDFRILKLSGWVSPISMPASESTLHEKLSNKPGGGVEQFSCILHDLGPQGACPPEFRSHGS